MKLSDVYDQLQYGELSQVVFGSGDIDGTGKMPKASYARLLPFIRAGLTELHKQFSLSEKTATVTLVDGTVSYILSDQTDLLKIERVYGTYLEKEYQIPLDEIDNPESIRNMPYNGLVIPDDTETAPWLLETATLRVVFRADHPALDKIMAENLPSSVVISLPPTYLEALTFYVASRVCNAKGSTAEFHEGNNYYMKFMGACETLRAYGMTGNAYYSADSDKFTDRGFV